MKRKILLLIVLFSVLFINGFEAAGYQAGLGKIAETFALTDTNKGLIVFLQLGASFISPLLFGPLADKRSKKAFLIAFSLLEILACAFLSFGQSFPLFAIGISLFGFASGTAQYLVFAALADLFPVSGAKKVALATTFYSLGAVIAPLLMGLFLNQGVPWRWLFMSVGVVLCLQTIAFLFFAFTPFEEKPVSLESETVQGNTDWLGVFLLCAAMFAYVGYENGFAFFITSFLQDTLQSSQPYLALSLFWLAMIPSRALCGVFAAKGRQILLIASFGALACSLGVALSRNDIVSIVLAFPLGFFAGAIFPSCLSRSLSFAGKKQAMVTGFISASAGLGGAVMSFSLGALSDQVGLTRSLALLSIVLGLLCVFALILYFKKDKKAPL
jgi:MFS transporter, FHS family, glucose/mannose:H+ symporter